MLEEHNNKLYAKLMHLRGEHRELDQKIAVVSGSKNRNDLELMRLKRQKLAIKDQISRLEEYVYPDITA
ncbi:MAG: YdcH family protein [Alphaproteobacteria bacterium]|nr:YdcH family protein [Alphaproteobacteria bacterium]